MKTFDFDTLLNTNTYPGRGICLGIDETGENAVIVYFIMGRSVNSRNRIFEESDDGIITKAYDESLMTDPHLIIYAPVRDMGDGRIIVTNGDRPTPSATSSRRARPSRRPCAPAPSRTTSPTAPPASPASWN